MQGKECTLAEWLPSKGPKPVRTDSPPIIVKFWVQGIGVVQDTKCAFLQIVVAEKEHDFLRFIWWKNFKERNSRYSGITGWFSDLAIVNFSWLPCSVIWKKAQSNSRRFKKFWEDLFTLITMWLLFRVKKNSLSSFKKLRSCYPVLGWIFMAGNILHCKRVQNQVNPYPS